MKTNVGGTDRLFRAALGLWLLLAPIVTNVAVFENSVASAISVVLGLVMLGSAATKVCPVYSLLGYSTKRST